MATELEGNLNLILTEKNEKIIPENIKAGVTIFGVEGTLEAGSGESSYCNAKIEGYKSGYIYTALTEISELDTSEVTNMANMFYGCKNLRTISQLNTSDVTKMNGMFYECSSLIAIPQFDMHNVTVMANMCGRCTNLITIPQLDISSVTNIANAFKACTSLSDESLNNILAMCANATAYITQGTNMTLAYIGLTEEQATKCTTLSNYSAFTSAGWTTGY